MSECQADVKPAVRIKRRWLAWGAVLPTVATCMVGRREMFGETASQRLENWKSNTIVMRSRNVLHLVSRNLANFISHRRSKIWWRFSKSGLFFRLDDMPGKCTFRLMDSWHSCLFQAKDFRLEDSSWSLCVRSVEHLKAPKQIRKESSRLSIKFKLSTLDETVLVIIMVQNICSQILQSAVCRWSVTSFPWPQSFHLRSATSSAPTAAHLLQEVYHKLDPQNMSEVDL